MRYTLLLHYQENDADSLGQEAIDEGQLAFAAYADVLHRAGVLVAAEVLEPASMTEPWFRGSSLALLAPRPATSALPPRPPRPDRCHGEVVTTPPGPGCGTTEGWGHDHSSHPRHRAPQAVPGH